MEKLEEHKADPKTIWKAKNNVQMPRLYDDISKELVENDITPEYMINFFTSVGEKLFEEKLNNVLDGKITVYSCPRFDNHTSFAHNTILNFDDVKQVVNNIDIG